MWRKLRSRCCTRNCRCKLDCVGPQPLTLAEFVVSLREQMELRAAR